MRGRDAWTRRTRPHRSALLSGMCGAVLEQVLDLRQALRDDELHGIHERADPMNPRANLIEYGSVGADRGAITACACI